MLQSFLAPAAGHKQSFLAPTDRHILAQTVGHTDVEPCPNCRIQTSLLRTVADS